MEEPIPKAESDGDVAVLRAMAGVYAMPGMELRRIENVLKKANADTKIGMSKVSEGRADDGTAEGGCTRKAEQCSRHVEDKLVDHNFHPVETPVAEPIHVDCAVVCFVELPECRHKMHQMLDIPLEEIFDE